MAKRYIKFLLFFIVILFLSLLLGSCLSNQNPYTIEEFQKQVPFKIVVPTYFPKDVKHYPTGGGLPTKLESPNPEGSYGLGLVYSGSDRSKYIWIIEQNVMSVPATGLNEYVYLNIKDTEILEQEKAHILQPENTIIDGFEYNWNRNGVNLHVEIYGYDREECRKVIESMIY